MTHICVSNRTTIGSVNGLSPGRRQAIIWTNAGILLIGPLGTNFSEFLVEILIFSFKKMCLKVSSGKMRPFCLGLNELKGRGSRILSASFLSSYSLSWFIVKVPATAVFIKTSVTVAVNQSWLNSAHPHQIPFFKQCSYMINLNSKSIIWNQFDRQWFTASQTMIIQCFHLMWHFYLTVCDEYNAVNSSPPSAAYMCQSFWTALVQITACRLFGAKPISKPMLGYCQLDLYKQTSVKIESKF